MIWEPQYSVKLEEIDAQHRYFVSLLDRIEAMSTLHPAPYLTPVVHELARHARYHFAALRANVWA